MAASLANGSLSFLQQPALESSSPSSASSFPPSSPSCSSQTGLHAGFLSYPLTSRWSSSSKAWRSSSRFLVNATVATPEVVQEEVNYEELALQLVDASPLEIMDRALAMFKSDIAIAFSGAEDVALIEYAKLTGRPFRVFSLDTGRLNPETYRFFEEVEKHYGIKIEYMFPDASEVETLVRAKGMFSFYEDGHQECCRIRKVRPLRRALKGLKAWITGQRRDQSPGTRANVPIVQGNIENAAAGSNDNGSSEASVVSDLFLSEGIKTFSRANMEELVKSHKRESSWIVVLYAPWCPYCQAMESSFNALAEELSGSEVLVGKFNADKENKAYAMSELQMRSFPTILFFSKNLLKPIKYQSEQRDVESLLAFVRALQ